jgi:hypothetical protein
MGLNCTKNDKVVLCVTGEWRKLYNEELNGMYSLPNIVRVIKSRRFEIGGACSTCGGRERCVQGFGGEN